MKLYNSLKDITGEPQKESHPSDIIKFRSIFRSPVLFEALNSLVIMLYPMAPHISSELLNMLNKDNPNFNIQKITWPSLMQVEEERNEKCDLMVQINGKMRQIINLKTNIETINEELALKIIKENEKANKFIKEKKIEKIIFLKQGGKIIINILVNYKIK